MGGPVDPVEIQSWLKWVGSTSVPLCRIKRNTDQVLGIASAWLLNLGEKRILITAAHSLQKGVDWCVDIGPNIEGKNELYWPNEFSIIDGPELDLSAASVAIDLQPFHQERGPRGMIGEPILNHVFMPSEIVKPDIKEVFAFSGKIRAETLWSGPQNPTCSGSFLYANPRAPCFSRILLHQHQQIRGRQNEQLHQSWRHGIASFSLQLRPFA